MFISDQLNNNNRTIIKEVNTMPIIHVEMFEGRSLEKKRELTQGITDVVNKVTGNDPDHIHVIIIEHAKENWCRNNQLAVDRK